MKTFATPDAVSGIAGVLVSERGMDAVYEVLDYVCGGPLFTHMLPRAQELALAKAPMPEWLRTLDTSGCNRETWRTWIADVVAKHGPTVQLGKVAA